MLEIPWFQYAPGGARGAQHFSLAHVSPKFSNGVSLEATESLCRTAMQLAIRDGDGDALLTDFCYTSAGSILMSDAWAGQLFGLYVHAEHSLLMPSLDPAHTAHSADSAPRARIFVDTLLNRLEELIANQLAVMPGMTGLDPKLTPDYVAAKMALMAAVDCAELLSKHLPAKPKFVRVWSFFLAAATWGVVIFAVKVGGPLWSRLAESGSKLENAWSIDDNVPRPVESTVARLTGQLVPTAAVQPRPPTVTQSPIPRPMAPSGPRPGLAPSRPSNAGSARQPSRAGPSPSHNQRWRNYAT
jgi:hypothetical protein